MPKQQDYSVMDRAYFALMGYVSDKFDKFFAKVVPISAKMALESRAHHKDILLEDEYNGMLSELKKELFEKDIDDLDFSSEKFEKYKTNIKQIKKAI